MSAPAVTERVQRLRDAGVITGFRMEVDPAALGLPVTAFARIRPARRAAGQDRRSWRYRYPTQISECHRITGEDCFLIKVHAPTIGDLETVLDKFLVYGQTVTSIVVSSPVPSPVSCRWTTPHKPTGHAGRPRLRSGRGRSLR